MSTPTGDRPEPGGSAPAPTVSTAPPAATGTRWWSAIPSHLGPARTSTVVLALLFVAVFALWLQVKPDRPGVGTAGVGSVQPATTAPATEAPAPTTAPPTTEQDEPTTEDRTPTPTPTPTTSSPAPTTTEAPEDSDEPAPTTSTGPAGDPGTTAPTTP